MIEFQTHGQVKAATMWRAKKFARYCLRVFLCKQRARVGGESKLEKDMLLSG
jgi:hypothetical protein